MQKYIRFLVALAAVSTIFVAKAARSDTSIHGEPLTINVANRTDIGFRFVNADGRPNHGDPIIFLHGLHSNLHEFEPMLTELMKLGFDCYAFNFPGHGNGDEKSFVTDYQEGDYGFEKMAALDFPAMVKKVNNLTGKKVTIIGHSMGGMIPRASIAMGTVKQRQIKSMVLIGSPPHFRKQLWYLPPGMEDFFRQKIFSGSGKDSINVVDAFDLEAQMDLMNFGNPLYWFMKAGAAANWGWAARAKTDVVPKDILRSFSQYQEYYPYEDVKIKVPTLYIVGDQDVLANSTTIVESAKIQSRDGGYWFITLNGVGHVSLVAPGALDIYKDSLQKFLESPKDLGPANETHLRGRPDMCMSGLMLGA